MKKQDRRNFIKSGVAVAGLAGLSPLEGLAEYMMPAERQKRNIYVFSKHLQWLDYKEMAKTAAKIGFDGVDLTVRPKGHVLPENVVKDLPRAVEAIRKQGLVADTITTAIDGVQFQHAEDTLKTAAKLGIKQYRMGWIDFDPSVDMEKDLQRIVSQLAELAEMNEHYGIRADYQNHTGDSFGAPIWDIWFVLKNLKSEWVGCRYDIRHATVEGTHSWPATLQAIAPYIRSLDIKDVKWDRADSLKVMNTPLGEGVVDFKKYLKMISDMNVPGNFTIHYEYPLGGANSGKYEITIPPEKVIAAIKKDLVYLKDLLNG
jgi:sugar phosphate isomerase/epimerase